MRKILVSFVALGLLSGCASLDDLVASTPDEAAYDRYGRDVYSALHRIAQLDDRWCEDISCAHWSGEEVVGIWRYRSARSCGALAYFPAEVVRPDDICVVTELQPRSVAGPFRDGIQLAAIGPRSGGTEHFSPREFLIYGLDQDLVVEH